MSLKIEILEIKVSNLYLLQMFNLLLLLQIIGIGGLMHNVLLFGGNLLVCLSSLCPVLLRVPLRMLESLLLMLRMMRWIQLAKFDLTLVILKISLLMISPFLFSLIQLLSLEIMVILIYRAQLIRLMMVTVCFWMIRVTRRYPQFTFFSFFFIYGG